MYKMMKKSNDYGLIININAKLLATKRIECVYNPKNIINF